MEKEEEIFKDRKYENKKDDIRIRILWIEWNIREKKFGEMLWWTN